MKTNLLLCCCLVLLLAVACRPEDPAAVAPAPATVALPAPSGAPAPRPLLDSFVHAATATLPAGAGAPRPENRLLVRRDADSLTVSGVVFAGDDRNARAAWRFYFRASARQCYAYLKQDYSRTEGGLQRQSSREAGYCLHFFPVAG